ncbi:Sulfate Permease (SulP) Family [Thraustotheca clavata]|uniref:Sulfate Permease (SulP) Family n=1 Tax=Thraustotheca clavata TaxID=74557 RepID=A0A1W0A8M3_9STRA|nr:Sulfate Permease (SulP) Family [Thraustotheca clavata]
MDSVGATARTPNSMSIMRKSYRLDDERLPILNEKKQSFHPEVQEDGSKYLKIALYGVINAIILVPLMISFAQIIFRDPVFQPYLSELVKLTMVSGAIHQLCFSISSTLPFAVGQVQDAGLIFLSAMASSIVHSLHMSGDAFTMEQVLSTTLFTLSGSTALLGIALVITGKLKLASFVQYLPMPVVGGYFAFIGFFCLQAGLSMMSGHEIKNIFDWGELFNLKAFILCSPGLIAGVFLFVVTQRVKHFTVLPTCMFTIVSLFFFGMIVSGSSFEDARAYGWIAPQPNGSMSFFDIYKHFQIDHFHSEFISEQIPTWIAMYFVVAFSSSLDVAAIEMALHRPLDHNAELQTVGWSNLVSGLTGGFTGSYIFSSTIFSMKSGVDSRLTGLLVFVLELALVASPFSIIAYVPKLFFASLQTLIAVDLIMEWLIHARKSMYLREYALVWFTFLVMIIWNLQGGIVLGIVGAAFNFILSYVNATTVRRAWKQSHVKRQFKERKELLKLRSAIVTLELDGYIFFGSSVHIISEVRKHILLTPTELILHQSMRSLSTSVLRTPRLMTPNVHSDNSHALMTMEEMTDYLSEYTSDAPIPAQRTRFLVLDFDHVRGIDVTAVSTCFNAMKQLLFENGICMVLCNLPADVEDMFRMHDICDDATKDVSEFPTKIFDTLDLAMEWCEENLLTKNSRPSRLDRLAQKPVDLLNSLLPHDNDSEAQFNEATYQKYIEVVVREKSDLVYQCGQDVNGFFMIGKGLVDVYLPRSAHERMGPGFKGRKRIMQVTSGALMGDVDLILNKKHSFTAEAKSDCSIFYITTDSFELMKVNHPKLAARFEKAMMRSMALWILEYRVSDQ